ncbi:hypothetical protein KM918_27950 [Priestia megaterium]|uniref:hypothetical protein n=1 Tax=Priestia megaterium TaxID=1404 RepID=UPI001C24C8D3|nr:hypothetical protein [Priestia megaterium]MBU8691116.1 hypothetical protein [Priestia megaterium]
MIDHLNSILITIIVLGTQHYLSTRNNPYLGGILPVGYIIFISFFFTKLVSENDRFSSFLMIIVGLTVLLGIWTSGREKLKKKRQKELDRIELQNL